MTATLLAATALADEVRLTGDRTLRGVVVRDSDEGVRIKLANGDVRNVPRAEIVRVLYDDTPARALDSAAPGEATAPGQGAAVVVVARPAAELEIDGARVAAEPTAEGSTARAQLAPGRHLVVARFDDGSTEDDEITVRGGQQQLVELERSALREFARYRGGPQLIFGGGAGFAASFEGGGGASGFGAELVIQLGYSIAPAFDLRAGLIGTLALDATYTQSFDDDSSFPTRTPATLVVARGALDAVFNIHPIYGPWLGFAAGGGTEGPVFGPRWALLDFRLGPGREIEISMPQQVLAADLPVYVQTLDVTYVMPL